MRYVEFKELIRKELVKHPDGLTWEQLKNQLKLPYKQPCQTWIKQMEDEIGLSRVRGTQRALIWKIPASQEEV
jgi:hypothetical protein